MSGDGAHEHDEKRTQPPEPVPNSPFPRSGADYWASHTRSANVTDANRERAQKADAHGGHDHDAHGGHGHGGAHTDANIVTPGVTPGVTVEPAPVTGSGAAGGAAPAGPTLFDTITWIVNGISWIYGTLLPAMAAEPEGSIGRNTALYCQGNAVNTGKPRVVLEPIVPMHDTDARVTASGQDPTTHKAWAWGGVAASNISINVNGLGGYHSGTRIGLVTRTDLAGGKFSDATVRQFLIHEVQHDSDHHESSKEGGSEGGGFDDGAWRWFKTEYRSYWLDGGYDHLSTTKQHTATHASINGGAVIPGKNEKSFQILLHIWTAGAYTGIVNAYNGSQRFKDLVHAHNGVDSANPTNDPLVDDFVRSITAQQMSSVVTSWAAMSEAQRSTCRNNGEIERLIQSMYGVTKPERHALLGFVKSRFNEDDFQQALRFCKAVYHGEEGSMTAEARGLDRARDWLVGSEEFRTFAEHHTTFPNNGPWFCMNWNASDVIGLLNGTRPPALGDFPINPDLTGCFAAGTPVLMADGTWRAIEAIAVGDEVLAFDETSRRVVGRRVTQTHAHAAEPTFRAHVTGVSAPLVVTAQHRFFLADRRAWVRFGELSVGTELFHYDVDTREATPRVLHTIEPAEVVPVYNLSVAEHPSYFVAGILVHNTKMA